MKSGKGAGRNKNMTCKVEKVGEEEVPRHNP